jgi:hypothetical protein
LRCDMEFEFDLTDLKDSAVRRMLRHAISKEKNRSLPMHKRKPDGKLDEVDDATEEAEEENEKLADLAEEGKGKPAPVEMDDEDMSDEAMETLEPPKKKAKKKA